MADDYFERDKKMRGIILVIVVLIIGMPGVARATVVDINVATDKPA